METTKHITAPDIVRSEHAHGPQALLPATADPYRIDDPRAETIRRLEAAWQRAVAELFAERLAA